VTSDPVENIHRRSDCPRTTGYFEAMAARIEDAQKEARRQIFGVPICVFRGEQCGQRRVPMLEGRLAGRAVAVGEKKSA